MRVSFWYEYGRIYNIGTGHKYRSRLLGGILEKRGHKIKYIEDDVIMKGEDVIVLDHMDPPEDVVNRSRKACNTLVVIDGVCDEADISISAFQNKNADYQGIDYIAFAVYPHTTKYDSRKKSKDIFVGMGGYDANEYAERVANILKDIGLNAIIAKSINHDDISERLTNVCMFEEDNYYDTMHECLAAITNGGLTMFQALHYGMPVVAVPQYNHQKTNIDAVSGYCIASGTDDASIKDNINMVVHDEYRREWMSRFAQYYVDGKGAERVCNIIERRA